MKNLVPLETTADHHLTTILVYHCYLRNVSGTYRPPSDANPDITASWNVHVARFIASKQHPRCDYLDVVYTSES